MPELQDGARDSKKKLLRFYEAMNTGDDAIIDEVVNDILAPDWINDPVRPTMPPGSQSFKPTIKFIRSVFPDFTITHEDMVISPGGEQIAVRSVSSGTHQGNFMGIEATGKRIEYRAFDFHNFKDGRLVHCWHLEDFFAAFRQLGAYPPAS